MTWRKRNRPENGLGAMIAKPTQPVPTTRPAVGGHDGDDRYNSATAQAPRARPARHRRRLMPSPIHITVTGAAGQISYSLLFRIASGAMLGPEQPVVLRLLEITPALDALAGVAMELEDCAFPLLRDIVCTDQPETAFADTAYVLLVGAQPRKAGMERKDLLEANAGIFSVQGKAIDAVARRDVRVLAVGNPANTNALIAQRNAPGLEPGQFTAMTRLDHNRALAQLCGQTGQPLSAVRQMTIWGNHSATQYPDLSHTTVNGQPALALVERDWYEDTLIPTVQQRGAAIIQARGASSAASAANAAIDHMRDWALNTPADDWTSMAVPSDGSYGIAEGVIYSYPTRCVDGEHHIVQGLDIDEFSRLRMDATHRELQEERDAIAALLP